MKTPFKYVFAVLAFWLVLFFAPFLLYILIFRDFSNGLFRNIVTILLNALSSYLSIKAVKSILDEHGYTLAIVNVTIAIIMFIIFIVTNFISGTYYSVIQNAASIAALVYGCIKYKEL